MARNCRPVLASDEIRLKSASRAWSLAISSRSMFICPTALIMHSRSSFTSRLTALSDGAVDDDGVEEDDEEGGEKPVPSPAEETDEEDEDEGEEPMPSPTEETDEDEDEGGKEGVTAVVEIAAALFSSGAAPLLCGAAAGALRVSVGRD